MDRQEIKFLLNCLDSNRKYLNSLQHEFISSLKKIYNATGVLTKRQVECLYDIKEYILSLALTDAVYEPESDKNMAQYSSFDYLSPFNM